MLRLWNLSLVLATFCLTILGTFLTRSGVINSVHAFSQSPIGPLLLAFLGVCATTSILLIAWRADRLRSPGQIDSPVSREAAFLVNNLLFAAFMLVVLLGTVFPLLAEAYDDRQISVGEPYFNDMTRPIAFALLFLMGAAPLLPWRAAGIDVLHRRMIAPATVATSTMVIAVTAGLGGVSPVLAAGLASFAITGIATQMALNVRGHRVRHRRTWMHSAIGAFAHQHRLFGGLIVHGGVAVVALALAIAPTYSADRAASLSPGDSVRLRGYEITYLDSTERTGSDRTVQTVTFGIEHNGRNLGVLAPAITRFKSGQAIGTPSVRTGLIEDLYLSLSSPPGDDLDVGLRVRVNPMMLWLWIGLGVMAFGTAVAAWPTRRRKPTSKRTSTDENVGNEPVHESPATTVTVPRTPEVVP